MIATPPAEWFRDPGLDDLTPLTVTPEGRVYGHLAGWNVRHRGLNGYITPPRSRSGYADFLLHSTKVRDGDEVRDITTGNLTMSTGHAEMNLSADAAREHYDSTGAVVASVAVGEDSFGVWFAGAVLPDVNEIQLRRFMACGLSGDWRRSDSSGSLELVACLSVPVPGFAIPRARVASGMPLALVAAGALMRPVDMVARQINPGWLPSGEASGEPISVMLDYDALAAALAPKLMERQAQHAALMDTRAALLASLDDTEERWSVLLAALDDGDGALTADISTMPPQLKESYLVGEVAQRIQWRTPGDFTRCVKQAKIHGMGHKAEGACATLHKLATGVYPGDKKNK